LARATLDLTEIGDLDRFSSPRKLWGYTRDDRLAVESTGR
jgi:hypothetical protein